MRLKPSYILIMILRFKTFKNSIKKKKTFKNITKFGKNRRRRSMTFIEKRKMIK